MLNFAAQSALFGSHVGLGTWPMAGNEGILGYGPADECSVEALLERAGEKGLRLVDTAASYGGGLIERVLGSSSKLRDFDFQVVTKCGWDLTRSCFTHEPKAIARQVDASINLLQQYEPPIVLLHSPPPELIDRPELYQPLIERKRVGAIRAIGVSVRYFEHAALALGCEQIDVVQLPYNPLIWEHEGDLLSALAQDGKQIIARELLASGLLTDRYPNGHRFKNNDMRANWPTELRRKVETLRYDWRPFLRDGESWLNFAVRFALDRSEITAVIVGAHTLEQIDILAQQMQGHCSIPFSRYVHNQIGEQNV